MFSNPREGPESSATFALLMFVIPAQPDQRPGGVLGVWPSYQTRDNTAAVPTTPTQKEENKHLWSSYYVSGTLSTEELAMDARRALEPGRWRCDAQLHLSPAE